MLPYEDYPDTDHRTMNETLTNHDRSWVLLTIGTAMVFGALGAMWMGAKGVVLTGIAFIVVSFLALWT